MGDAILTGQSGGKKPVGNALPTDVVRNKTFSTPLGYGLRGRLDIEAGSYIPEKLKGWTPRTVEASTWRSVCYGNGLFVAVASSGTNRLMTSTDGINWTPRTVEASAWVSVCYGNGLFVAVAISGTNRVMTSPDGITWTRRTVEASAWRSVCYGNGLFVAVAYDGTNRVMTSDVVREIVKPKQSIVNLVNSISYTGTYASTLSARAHYLGFNTDGDIIIVHLGANDSAYENIYFTLNSVPSGSGITLVAGSSSPGTSITAGSIYYGAILRGVTQKVNLEFICNTRNSSSGYYQIDIKVTYA